LHAGRTEPSLGRRRRDLSGNDKNKTAVEKPKESAETTPGEEEKVRQVIEVRFDANRNRYKLITNTYKKKSINNTTRWTCFSGIRKSIRHAFGTTFDIGTCTSERLFDKQRIL